MRGQLQSLWTFVVAKPVKLAMDARGEIVGERKLRITRDRLVEQRQRSFAVLVWIANSTPTKEIARPDEEVVGLETRRRRRRSNR